ncbi:hypothetical protein ISS06_00690 [Patescibacteria group bacterium]|nr:hypothetical protein [Patescibacteria group bacterium]
MSEEKIEDIFKEVERSSKKQTNQETFKQEADLMANKNKSPIKVRQVNVDNPLPKKLLLKKFLKPTILIIIVIMVVGGALYGWKNLKQTNQPEIIIPIVNPAPEVNVQEKDESIIKKDINDDADRDGLKDEEESALGTNKNKIDSDDDGLSDYEEVKIYLTDPLNKDTDGDGNTDGDEIKNRKDPNNPDVGALLFNLQEEIKKLK